MAIILVHLADTNEGVAAVTLLMLCGDFAPALLAPFIGVLADRVELERLMLICEFGQAAATIVIAIWLPALPLFLALFTLRAVLGHIFQPASRTAVPALVPDADLESANAHLGFGEHGLSVLGPLLAAVLVPFIGVRGLLLFDAGTFMVSALLLMGLPAMTAPPLGLEQESSFLRNAADGLRFLWRNAGPRLVVFSFVVGVAFTGVDDLALTTSGHRHRTYPGTLDCQMSTSSARAAVR